MNSYHNSQIRRKLVLLARSSPRTRGAAGNCWREHLQRYEMMTSEEQLRAACEESGFVRTVSEGLYYKICEDVTDGFGNLIASCRECTFSRTHRDSEPKLWVYKYTERGAVFDVKVISETLDAKRGIGHWFSADGLWIPRSAGRELMSRKLLHVSYFQ